jgi:hypothetical protein
MAFFRGMTGVSPVLGGVLAYGVYRVFYIEAGINGLGRRFPTQALPAAPSTAPVSIRVRLRAQQNRY